MEAATPPANVASDSVMLLLVFASVMALPAMPTAIAVTVITLPESGPILLTIDAAYTVDHWENRALPGLVTSSTQAADSVAKLRRIAQDTNAMVVTGHDPVTWPGFRKSPQDFYD